MGHPWLPPRVAGGCHPFPSRAGVRGGGGITTQRWEWVLRIPSPCWCPHPRPMFLHEVDTTLYVTLLAVELVRPPRQQAQARGRPSGPASESSSARVTGTG